MVVGIYWSYAQNPQMNLSIDDAALKNMPYKESVYDDTLSCIVTASFVVVQKPQDIV